MNECPECLDGFPEVETASNGMCWPCYERYCEKNGGDSRHEDYSPDILLEE